VVAAAADVSAAAAAATVYGNVSQISDEKKAVRKAVRDGLVNAENEAVGAALAAVTKATAVMGNRRIVKGRLHREEQTVQRARKVLENVRKVRTEHGGTTVGVAVLPTVAAAPAHNTDDEVVVNDKYGVADGRSTAGLPGNAALWLRHAQVARGHAQEKSQSAGRFCYEALVYAYESASAAYLAEMAARLVPGDEAATAAARDAEQAAAEAADIAARAVNGWPVWLARMTSMAPALPNAVDQALHDAMRDAADRLQRMWKGKSVNGVRHPVESWIEFRGGWPVEQVASGLNFAADVSSGELTAAVNTMGTAAVNPYVQLGSLAAAAADVSAAAAAALLYAPPPGVNLVELWKSAKRAIQKAEKFDAEHPHASESVAIGRKLDRARKVMAFALKNNKTREPTLY
jgi:hypothetical protein